MNFKCTHTYLDWTLAGAGLFADRVVAGSEAVRGGRNPKHSLSCGWIDKNWGLIWRHAAWRLNHGQAGTRGAHSHYNATTTTRRVVESVSLSSERTDQREGRKAAADDLRMQTHTTTVQSTPHLPIHPTKHAQDA